MALKAGSSFFSVLRVPDPLMPPILQPHKSVSKVITRIDFFKIRILQSFRVFTFLLLRRRAVSRARSLNTLPSRVLKKQNRHRDTESQSRREQEGSGAIRNAN